MGNHIRYHITHTAAEGGFTDGIMQLHTDSTLAQAMIGKKEGDEFEVWGERYKIFNIL